MPAVARLQVPKSGAADACIGSWDTESTGVSVPPFPWSSADIGPGGTVIGYHGSRFRTLYRDDAAGYHSLSMFDSETGAGYVWFRHHAHVHWYERAEPLRAEVHWALTSDVRFLAHASAVGDQRGALLLTGRGGAGKTTTVLAALDDGLHFVGDNYVLISLAGEPTVHGLYGTAKLWPETLERLPGLKPYVRTFDVLDDEKFVVDIWRYRPESVVNELPIRAVVVSEVTGARETRISPCTRVDAMLALAPTTVFQLPKTDHGLLGFSELVRRVPTFKLDLGGDLPSGPRALSRLLDSFGRT